jgi:hypothetical protein
MRYRILFFLLATFFVAMNVLLWRAEIAGHNELFSNVSEEVVWQKILTAPDNSRLVIEHYGVKIGTCIWAPAVGEEVATGKLMTDDLPPEGMVKKLSGYTLDVDGSVSLDNLTRVRFTAHLKLATNQALTEITVRLNFRPDRWEIQSVLADQTLKLVKEEDGVTSERIFRLGHPQHLEKLLAEFGLTLPPGTLEGLGLRADSARAAIAAVGATWRARSDWLAVGSTRMRVYRLEARLLARYTARLYVSPVGEIIRVELPDKLVLKNDALQAL